MRFDPKAGGEALRTGRLLVLYCPPDLEPGEAATAHAIDLPAGEAWTRAEFQEIAATLPSVVQALHRGAMGRRAEVADRVWRLLEEVVELGGQVTVWANLAEFDVLTVDFFPEALDTEEWWGFDVSYNVAIEGPHAPGGLWGAAASIIQNCSRGLERRREWLERRNRG